MGQHYDKARILFDQGNFRLAEKELEKEIAIEPGHSEARGLLACCLVNRNKHLEAVQQLRIALSSAPDNSYLHYVRAFILHSKGDSEAAAAIAEALRLNPEAADYWALQSNMHLNEGKWALALSAAESGLAIEPYHLVCLNWRALALQSLGRIEEAAEALNTALGAAPNDAITLSQKGWLSLAKGNIGEAIGEFESALRIAPDMDWARKGLLTALKSKNRFYHVMHSMRLVHFLRFIGWICLFALLVFCYFARSGVSYTPQYFDWMLAVLSGYMILELTSTLIEPAFNSVLRLQEVGRRTLSPAELRQVDYMAGCSAITAALLLAWFFMPTWRLLYLSLTAACMSIPISVSLEQRTIILTRFMQGYVKVSIAAAAVATITILLCPEDLSTLDESKAFIVVCILFANVIFSIFSRFVAEGLLPDLEKMQNAQLLREAEKTAGQGVKRHSHD